MAVAPPARPVGPRGDLTALITQHTADRLDRTALSLRNGDQRHPATSFEERNALSSRSSPPDGEGFSVIVAWTALSPRGDPRRSSRQVVR
jgi:hypothetical protein